MGPPVGAGIPANSRLGARSRRQKSLTIPEEVLSSGNVLTGGVTGVDCPPLSVGRPSPPFPSASHAPRASTNRITRSPDSANQQPPIIGIE
ncbi:hypothetical protein J6590_017339 [Homalodisca vitripennis]|nr:hypothetical protein J6590_017339 [Homalodisca vitripennis]